MKIEVRPLSGYPVPETRVRRPAPFHRWVRAAEGSWKRREPVLLSDSLDLLRREGQHLACTHLVIEADIREQDLRQDGELRASARPTSPRVVVSLLDSTHGPLRYPCDTYLRYADNVRAVALALEALRTVDRYGVTRRGEQYAGWRALPGAGQTTDTSLDRQGAEAIIQQYSGLTGIRPAGMREAIRMALFATHPDHGGSPEAFARVQAARRVLTAAGVRG